MESKKLMGLAIIGIMVLSTVALVVVDLAVGPSTTLKYNGLKFKLVNQQYVAKIDGKQHTFIFFPRDIEYIQIPDDVKLLLQKPILTVTYNPNSTLASNFGEAQYYLETQLSDVKMIDRAVTNKYEGIELSLKTCAEATEAQPVIELLQSNQSIIKAEGNCIKVQALDDLDLYQETERLVYTVLGVMS